MSKTVTPQSLAETLGKWLLKDRDEGESGRMKNEQWAEQRCNARSDVLTVWDRTDLLERLMGDEELARTILDGFLVDIPRQTQALRSFLEAGDAPGAERQAHTIKGASATVGGEALREAAFEMEQAARTGDLEAVWALLEKLETRFEEFKKAIETA